MSTIQYIAAGAAVVVAAWPLIQKAPGLLSRLPGRRSGPSYEAAIGQLAQVRLRLVATGHLADDQTRAIDVLTLALVDGSDA